MLYNSKKILMLRVILGLKAQKGLKAALYKLTRLILLVFRNIFYSSSNHLGIVIGAQLHGTLRKNTHSYVYYK